MKYRITAYPAIEASKSYIVMPFETAEQMIVAKDAMANLLLFIQDSLKVMSDYSNVFIMEELVSGDWEEYEEFGA